MGGDNNRTTIIIPPQMIPTPGDSNAEASYLQQQHQHHLQHYEEQKQIKEKCQNKNKLPLQQQNHNNNNNQRRRQWQEQQQVEKRKVHHNHNDHNVLRLHPNDIVCGRGGYATHHIGNQKYLSIVASYQEQYRNIKCKRTKTQLSRKIVQLIREKYGGRFLKKDPITKLWYEVSDHQSRRKIAQALREVAFEQQKKKQEQQQFEQQQQHEQQQDKEKCRNIIKSPKEQSASVSSIVLNGQNINYCDEDVATASSSSGNSSDNEPYTDVISTPPNATKMNSEESKIHAIVTPNTNHHFGNCDVLSSFTNKIMKNTNNNKFDATTTIPIKMNKEGRTKSIYDERSTTVQHDVQLEDISTKKYIIHNEEIDNNAIVSQQQQQNNEIRHHTSIIEKVPPKIAQCNTATNISGCCRQDHSYHPPLPASTSTWIWSHSSSSEEEQATIPLPPAAAATVATDNTTNISSKIDSDSYSAAGILSLLKLRKESNCCYEPKNIAAVTNHSISLHGCGSSSSSGNQDQEEKKQLIQKSMMMEIDLRSRNNKVAAGATASIRHENYDACHSSSNSQNNNNIKNQQINKVANTKNQSIFVSNPSGKFGSSSSGNQDEEEKQQVEKSMIMQIDLCNNKVGTNTIKSEVSNHDEDCINQLSESSSSSNSSSLINQKQEEEKDYWRAMIGASHKNNNNDNNQGRELLNTGRSKSSSVGPVSLFSNIKQQSKGNTDINNKRKYILKRQRSVEKIVRCLRHKKQQQQYISPIITTTASSFSATLGNETMILDRLKRQQQPQPQQQAKAIAGEEVCTRHHQTNNNQNINNTKIRTTIEMLKTLIKSKETKDETIELLHEMFTKIQHDGDDDEYDDCTNNDENNKKRREQKQRQQQQRHFHDDELNRYGSNAMSSLEQQQQHHGNDELDHHDTNTISLFGPVNQYHQCHENTQQSILVPGVNINNNVLMSQQQEQNQKQEKQLLKKNFWYYYLEMDPYGKPDGWYPYDTINQMKMEEYYWKYKTYQYECQLQSKINKPNNNNDNNNNNNNNNVTLNHYLYYNMFLNHNPTRSFDNTLYIHSNKNIKATYKIDLQLMTQTNIATGKLRPICRTNNGLRPPTSLLTSSSSSHLQQPSSSLSILRFPPNNHQHQNLGTSIISDI